MNNLINNKIWQKLLKHRTHFENKPMRDWIFLDKNRFLRMNLSVDGLFLDYSRNILNEETLSLLIDLAKDVGLAEKINALFEGDLLNFTEKRPALHTALRDLNSPQNDISKNIHFELDQLKKISDHIHSGHWRGVTGKKIKYIVNIGIGGSYIGPHFLIDALERFSVDKKLDFYFVSSVDKLLIQSITSKINVEETVFIISSKTFTTIETLTNANCFRDRLIKEFGEAAIQNHFIAITAAPNKAKAWGISEKNIFNFWSWVGGRYSVWSAIALPLILKIGFNHFISLLKGAHKMDLHFKEAPFAKNMPVILGLLSVWYVNFFNASAEAIIPYDHRLLRLIPYLQQLEMESNGKSVNAEGNFLNYETCPVIFGEEGCRGQHAYHQLLHQGTRFIPVSFILRAQQSDHNEQDDILFASALSQALALMKGKTIDEAYEALIKQGKTESEANTLAKHQQIPGNRPSNILMLEDITPYTLGLLLALYEHKVFVEGVIWNINSFDQWGVELGKELLPSILSALKGECSGLQLDDETMALIKVYKNKGRP